MSGEKLTADMTALKVKETDDYRDGEIGSASGGVTIKDGHMAERQKAFISRTMRSLGAKFFEGKPFSELSLHVSVFEARSFLERIVEEWDYATEYLTAAAHATDPVERIKYVAAFIIAGLHGSANLAKPFNPILGETYEAEWSDGTKVFLEQTSHHPPVTHWIAVHPKGLYKFFGFGMINGRVNMLDSSVKTRRCGMNVIEFADFALNLDAKFLGVFGSSQSKPSDYFRGVIYHAKTLVEQKLEFCGVFNPVENGKESSVFLRRELLDTTCIEMRTDAEILALMKALPKEAAAPKDHKTNHSKSEKTKSHHASSLISRGGSTILGKANPGIFTRGHSGKNPSDNLEIFARAEGTYVGFLDFDGQRYWDIRTAKPDRAKPSNSEVLPTDARLRKDVEALRAVLEYETFEDSTDEQKEKLFDKAQEVKEELEKLQRADKKLRVGEQKFAAVFRNIYPLL